jgi:hypothetical protein
MDAPIATRHCAALMGLLALPLSLHAAPMQPGQWEMAMTFTLDKKTETVPAGRACITQKDIDDPTKTLPRPAGVCNLTNIKRTADRVTYELACQDNHVRTRGVADITFNGDRYDGRVELVLVGKTVTGVPAVMTVNARRVGDCAP